MEMPVKAICVLPDLVVVKVPKLPWNEYAAIYKKEKLIRIYFI